MTDAPAASFILLSYCQEDTIAAAVESLLDQKCEPLEIILSDDASPDRTFAIIEETVSGYSGPHTVIARRNDDNMGVNRHAELLINMAKADLMIFTAGDDINLPHRAFRTIEAHRETGAKLLYSDARTTTREGTPGNKSYRGAVLYGDYTLEKVATGFALYLGATVAWHKDLHRKYGGWPRNNAHEDLILGFRAAMEESLHYIPEELVTYLENAGVSSHLSRKSSGLENRARRAAILKGQITVLGQRLKDADTFGLAQDHPGRRAMLALKDRLDMRLSYYTGGKTEFANRPLKLTHALASEWLRDIRNR